MPKRIAIAIPGDRSERLVEEFRRLPGLFSMSVQHNASIHPPGDVVELVVSNEALFTLLRSPLLRELGRDEGVTITTGEVSSVVAPAWLKLVSRGRTEASWEEIETALAKESNMTPNGMLVMAFAGILAVIGITTNALHIVIAAMIIAPGFEPLSRIALGMVNRNGLWRNGLRDTGFGYAALVVGAGLAAVALAAAGYDPIATEPSYLPRVLLSYWTRPDPPSILGSVIAGLGGGLVIAMNRSILTAGVMVALALIPSAAIIGMALPFGQFDLAAKALLRWTTDAVLVLVTAWLVFRWKRASMQKRTMFP